VDLGCLGAGGCFGGWGWVLFLFGGVGGGWVGGFWGFGWGGGGGGLFVGGGWFFVGGIHPFRPFLLGFLEGFYLFIFSLLHCSNQA